MALPTTTGAGAGAAEEDDLTKPPPTLDDTAAGAGNDDDDDLEAASARAADEEGTALVADADGAVAGAKGGEGGEGNKLKVLVGLLKKVVGVKDLAAIRFSLPATLLEPVPNLEYWTYLDRADLWANIPDFDKPLDRMLAVLRFTLTKELKYVKGKVCKPYNSVLGEHFRCHWEVETPTITANKEILLVQALEPGITATPLPLAVPSSSLLLASSASSISGKKTINSRPGSIKAGVSGGDASTSSASASASAERPQQRRGLSKLLGGGGGKENAGSAASGNGSSLMLDRKSSSSSKSGTTTAAAGGEGNEGLPSQKRRVAFLTEQVSHHPPISTFYCTCAEAGITLCGVDQLSAKFTGASVKVYSGEQNKGIFVKLDEKARGKGAQGEEYQITHPTASINGFFRGSIWVAISEQTYVTCRGGGSAGGKKLRTIVEYKDESWIAKAKYALEGVIYEYDEADDPDEITKIKQVPSDSIVATFDGTWRGDINYKLKGDRDSRLLIRLGDLQVTKKTVRPLEAHEEMESRKIWQSVTEAIHSKEFSKATKYKQEIEQAQRDKAAERKKKGEEFVPAFFQMEFSDGRPKLTEAGKKALEDEANLIGYKST